MFLMGQGSKECDPNPPGVKSRCVQAGYRRKNRTSGKGEGKKRRKKKGKGEILFICSIAPSSDQT